MVRLTKGNGWHSWKSTSKSSNKDTTSWMYTNELAWNDQSLCYHYIGVTVKTAYNELIWQHPKISILVRWLWILPPLILSVAWGQGTSHYLSLFLIIGMNTGSLYSVTKWSPIKWTMTLTIGGVMLVKHTIGIPTCSTTVVPAGFFKNLIADLLGPVPMSMF